LDPDPRIAADTDETLTDRATVDPSNGVSTAIFSSEIEPVPGGGGAPGIL
jgi:hypothetical protein